MWQRVFFHESYKLVHNATKLSNARPKESQLKLEVELDRVPYNQTFDFVTGQFAKILSPACL